MPDRLIGPRLKIKRADKHVADLEMARQEFVATDPYTHFAEDEAETGDLVYRVTVEWAIPMTPVKSRLGTRLA